MGKSVKQVYSTLKIDDNQIQILTAEYFNTRFNVINTYCEPVEGISDYKINDKSKLIESIKTAVDVVSVKIGARLEKVIVVLPPYNFKKHSLRVSIIPSNGIIKKSDVARAITNSLNTEIDSDKLVINTLISKYIVNGISSRRFPENETCDEALVDIDLLCADKALAYGLVDAVSKAGLEVLDLTLNNYAIVKEGVLLDSSINQNIILLDIGSSVTYLTLLSKGKIASSEIIFDGLNNLYQKVYDTYHLPPSVIPRLVIYNTDFNSSHPSDAVFAWNDEDDSYSISVQELSNLVDEPLNAFVDKILTMCGPILEQGASFYLCGDGSNMNALVERLKTNSNAVIKAYYPDTIGARNANYCAIYGGLFVYKQKADLNDLSVNCVNISEYDKTLDKIEVDVEGETITSKIKNLFEMYRHKEGI